MAIDACASFEGERHWKKRILVSSQAVLHTNNAIIGTQKKENNKIFQNKGIQKEIQDHSIATLKKEGKRRWIKRQIHQLNTTQKHHWKNSYTNYTQPVKSASHDQRWAKLANQQASDAARRPIKNRPAALPIKYKIIQKKGGRGGRENDRERLKNRDAGGGASPH